MQFEIRQKQKKKSNTNIIELNYQVYLYTDHTDTLIEMKLLLQF